LAIIYFYSAHGSQVHVPMFYLKKLIRTLTQTVHVHAFFVQVTGFLEKNRDGLKPDLEELISRCGNKVCSEVFLNCC